jgi:hypothetical protein
VGNISIIITITITIDSRFTGLPVYHNHRYYHHYNVRLLVADLIQALAIASYTVIEQISLVGDTLGSSAGAAYTSQLQITLYHSCCAV